MTDLSQECESPLLFCSLSHINEAYFQKIAQKLLTKDRVLKILSAAGDNESVGEEIRVENMQVDAVIETDKFRF